MVSELRVPFFDEDAVQVSWDKCGKLTGSDSSLARLECLSMEWICSPRHFHMQVFMYIVLVCTTVSMLACLGAATEAAFCRSKESLMKKGDDSAWLLFRRAAVRAYVKCARGFAFVAMVAAMCVSLMWDYFIEKLAKVYRDQGVEERGMGCASAGECFTYGVGYWMTVISACALPMTVFMMHGLFTKFEKRTPDQFREELARQKAQEYLKSTAHIRREAAQKIGSAMEAVEAIRKLGEFGSSLLTHLRLEHFDDEELERAFDEVDEDGSGEIDHDEVRIFLHKVMKRDPPKESLKEFIDRFDEDGDGVIDFDEFTTGITKMRRERAELSAREKKANKLVKTLKLAVRRDTMIKSLQVATFDVADLEMAFKGIDEDNSGTIDRDEVPHLLAELLQAPPPASAVKAFLKEFDKDGDGSLTMAEFVDGMTRLREEQHKASNPQLAAAEVKVKEETEPEARTIKKGAKRKEKMGVIVKNVYVAQDPMGNLPEEISLRLDTNQLVIMAASGDQHLFKWRWTQVTDLALEKSMDNDVMDLITMNWTGSKYSFEMNDASPTVRSMLEIQRARLATTALPGWTDPGPTTVHPLDVHDFDEEGKLPETLVLWMGPSGLDFMDTIMLTTVYLHFDWQQIMSFAEGEEEDEEGELDVLQVGHSGCYCYLSDPSSETD